ncbi:hypothetical protein J5277_09310 [Rhizobium sp. 16-449-1b]|nr:hypothetical protein [Rhizobium sp. 16-449-1b]
MYTDAATIHTTTFGPLDKYLPANDNDPFPGVRRFGAKGGIVGQPVDKSGQSAGFEVSEPRGRYIGLRRTNEGRFSVVLADGSEQPIPPERAGDFMQTATGRRFWPMDPRADEVFIEDIAHSLAMQTRYAGHCLRFYSVAEHSVLMARHLRQQGADVALFALLHDASEAYLVDVPRPVKPYLTGYKAAEANVMAAVCERFSLAKEMPAPVHEADDRIIGDELANLVPMDWHARYAGKELGVRLRYWSPEQAKEEFLVTFDALMSGRAREAA